MENKPAYGREITLRIEGRDFNETALIGKSANFIFNPQTRNGEELSDFLSGCEDSALEKWQSTAKELAEALEKSIEQNDKWALHAEDYDNIDKYNVALQKFKTLTDDH